MKQDIIILQPVIETARMILRPLRASDVGLMTLYAADRRVAQMTTSIPHPYPPGAAEQFVARATRPDRTDFTWAMDASDRGRGRIAWHDHAQADGPGPI